MHPLQLFYLERAEDHRVLTFFPEILTQYLGGGSRVYISERPPIPTLMDLITV